MVSVTDQRTRLGGCNQLFLALLLARHQFQTDKLLDRIADDMGVLNVKNKANICKPLGFAPVVDSMQHFHIDRRHV